LIAVFVGERAALDLSRLIENPASFPRVPVSVAARLVVRGLPAPFLSRLFDRRSVLAAAVHQAASHPFIVTAMRIGLRQARLSEVARQAGFTRQPPRWGGNEFDAHRSRTCPTDRRSTFVRIS
jgi:hypothetical protein